LKSIPTAKMKKKENEKKKKKRKRKRTPNAGIYIKMLTFKLI
jgi:hypothetical protein